MVSNFIKVCSRVLGYKTLRKRSPYFTIKHFTDLFKGISLTYNPNILRSGNDLTVNKKEIMKKLVLGNCFKNQTSVIRTKAMAIL